MTERESRHSRQVRFAPIGAAGQAKLANSRVLVLGLGATGSALAELLARAGVGALRLVDRDLVEPSNLQRQCLYAQADADAHLPKAVAAAARLGAIAPACAIDARVAELTSRNALELVRGCDAVADGTDSFAPRHLINEACCQLGVPWVYTGAVGATAISMPIVPGQTACLRCLQSELPDPGDGPTCDSAGIIGPAVQLAAAWSAAELLKLLVGDHAALRHELYSADLWTNRMQRLDVRRARDPACAACGPSATWPALSATPDAAITLCGRDAVQIALGRPVKLDKLAAQVGSALTAQNDYLLRWRDGDTTLTCFADGRVLVQRPGETLEPMQARAVVQRWVG